MSEERLSGKPITPDDVKKYAESNSDFAFEMKVLHLLNGLQFGCEHGGTYRDQATGKAREFDIRAIWYGGSNYGLFPVECKNLREGSPLVVHAVPRPREDSFHQVIIRPPQDMQIDSSFREKSKGSDWRVVEVVGERTRYAPRELVGKHMDQISHKKKEEGVGKISLGGDGVFEKFSQALSSSVDLIARGRGFVHEKQCWAATVIPLLVVPNERLWMIAYDDAGQRLGEPRAVSKLSFLVRHKINVDMPEGPLDYVISHVELVTLSGLEALMKTICGSGIFI